jgi:hypothetical protein
VVAVVWWLTPRPHWRDLRTSAGTLVRTWRP